MIVYICHTQSVFIEQNFCNFCNFPFFILLHTFEKCKENCGPEEDQVNIKTNAYFMHIITKILYCDIS